MHQRHVFNYTVKTIFTNGIKNKRRLERNFTNILTKLEDDLPFNFEDTEYLRSMIYLVLLDILGERTIAWRRKGMTIKHSADSSSKKFTPTGVTKIINKKSFAIFLFV